MTALATAFRAELAAVLGDRAASVVQACRAAFPEDQG